MCMYTYIHIYIYIEREREITVFTWCSSRYIIIKGIIAIIHSITVIIIIIISFMAEGSRRLLVPLVLYSYYNNKIVLHENYKL